MRLHLKRFFPVIACLFILILIRPAFAQTPGQDLSLTSSSNSPIPGQTVTVSAQSYSADISAAKFTWSVNGTVIQSGIGLTTLDVVVPNSAKQTIVQVAMTIGGGSPIIKNLILGAGSVDLIVETDGYTPAFFPGKISPVYQNSVKIIAVPHINNSAGVEFSPSSLVYNWQKDNEVISNVSGYGKQSIIIPGATVPRPYDILVTVSAPGTGAQASSVITVNMGAPSITFYEDDPLYGPLFNKAITNTLHIGTEKESGVLAVPFGFNKPNNSTGDLALTWLINNIEHPELADHESIILRAPEDSTGQSNIELDIKNNSQILQSADASFTTIFDSAPAGTNATTNNGAGNSPVTF